MYSLILIVYVTSAGVDIGQIKVQHDYVSQSVCQQTAEYHTFEKATKNYLDSLIDLQNKYEHREVYNLKCEETK